MTAIWILAGIGYVVAIAAMMRSMAALGLPDRTEFDRAVHFRRLPEFAPDAADSSGSTGSMDSTEERTPVKGRLQTTTPPQGEVLAA